MHYGMTLPPFGALAEPAYLTELAVAAEAAGWDGFFLWDTVIHDDHFYPVADPWIALTAIAAATTRLRLGVMITPLSRRRPWQVARQATTLDRFSNGRLILGAGLGGTPDDFAWFGEMTDAKTRGQMLDEALAILDGLWRGERFSYTGNHYTLAPVEFRPRPVQTPRIPIWLGGMWPNKAPFRRAARYDGVFPLCAGFPPSVEEFVAIRDFIAAQRATPGPYAYVASGITPGNDPTAGAAQVAPYRAAGATWWLETVDPWTLAHDWSVRFDAAAERWMDARIRQPPPRV